MFSPPDPPTVFTNYNDLPEEFREPLLGLEEFLSSVDGADTVHRNADNDIVDDGTIDVESQVKDFNQLVAAIRATLRR